MTSENIENKPNKKAVGLLSLGHLISDSYGGFITPILPFIAANLGFSVSIAATLISLSSLSSSLLQPVYGYISDKLSRRYFLFTGIILASVFMSLSGLIGNIWFLAVAFFLGYLGIGFFHPQATGLVPVFAKKDVNKLMGIFVACGTLGYALGPIISSTIVNNFGLKYTWIAMIPGLIFALLLYLLLPKIPSPAKKTEKTSFKEMIKTIAKNKVLRSLTGISIIKALVVVNFSILIPFVWKAYKISLGDIPTLSLIGISLALFSGVGGFASIVGGWLADKIGKKTVFILSLTPPTPCLLLSLYFLDKSVLLSIILFVASSFFLMLSVSINMVMAQLAVPENKSMISGIIGGFSWGIGTMLLTPIGFLAKVFGTETMLAIVGIVPILGTLLIPALPKDID